MPYCHHFLKTNHGVDVDEVVKLLAKEQFHARDAYPMDNPEQYNIDESVNDVRAFTNKESNTIRLFCRYKRDVHRIQSKLTRFAVGHPDLCNVTDEKIDLETTPIVFKLTWK
jgi:RNA polymerase-binding transcription factor DksA